MIYSSEVLGVIYVATSFLEKKPQRENDRDKGGPCTQPVDPLNETFQVLIRGKQRAPDFSGGAAVGRAAPYQKKAHLQVIQVVPKLMTERAENLPEFPSPSLVTRDTGEAPSENEGPPGVVARFFHVRLDSGYCGEEVRHRSKDRSGWSDRGVVRD